MNTVIRSPAAESLAWLWYPLVTGTAVASHLLMMSVGIPVLIATYAPVMFAAVSITLLEIFFPYRSQWHPDRMEVVNDLLFMILVQVLLPQFLIFLVALNLTREIPFDIWPQQLPLFVQFLIMVLLADFLRYWLHVASHNFRPLWQLHAVHHSPHRLYWLNVGRFHPLEKALQFLFDSLPFILMGIREEVLALYFVFYAANGYFQHSNVKVQLGKLNYLISGPELHRWHHSIHIRESNRNYGNNIILWDLLFGTYFLPRKREVEVLGLKNRDYPLSFATQMKTPFIIRMESKALPLVTYREILINALLRVRFEYLYLTKSAWILNATRNPMTHQLRVLNNIIRRNENCGYGKDHNFRDIHDYAGFTRNCPVVTYDDLVPYVSTRNVEHCQLTTEKPVFFQLTSGTSGQPKFLPLTPAGRRVLESIQKRTALSRYLDNPGTFSGKIFGVVSPAIEGYTPSGIPYGSASGLTYMNMPRLSRTKYVVPYEIFNIEDYSLKYRLIALFALAESRVTLMATANPSTLLRILEVLNNDAGILLQALEVGDICLVAGNTVSDETRENFAARPANIRVRRVRQLKEVLSRQGHLSFKDIWPGLQSLVTWTGGSCGIPLRALARHLPADLNISDMGYLSSEVHATITYRSTLGIPTFLHNFFEFIPVADYEAGSQRTLLLHELQPGCRYYVIVTTVNGLYRYFMNDIVEVTELFNSTPALKFIQKGQGVTSITGEKLYEGQVLDAVALLEKKYDVAVVFQQWLADDENALYRVYLEFDSIPELAAGQIAEELDQALCQLNIEYGQKRSSGRLHGPEVFLLRRGTGEACKQSMLKTSTRDGQYKTRVLLYIRDAGFPFQEYLHNQ